MARSRLMIMVLLLAGCQAQSLSISSDSQSSNPPAGPPTSRSNSWVSVSYTGSADCTGEAILVSGDIHVESIVWNTPGRLRIQSHINENLSAEGLSTGRRYWLQQVKNEKFELDWTSGASESEVVFRFNVVSIAGAANFYATMNGTWRWDANGNVTLEPKRWELVCRG